MCFFEILSIKPNNFSSSTGKTSNSIEEKNEYIIKQLSILDQKLASKVDKKTASFLKCL